MITLFSKCLRIFPIGLISFCALLLSTQARAFMTVQESNEITPKGFYKLGIEPQVRTSNGSGSNFTGFFDLPINEEMSARAVLGAGDTDLNIGGSFKWVPVPDYDPQPAVGGKIGLYSWRESDNTFTTIRVEPLVSKKFQTEIGEFIPYGALPILFNSGKDSNKTGVQVALGCEFRHAEADNMTFGLEAALDAKDSFAYVSGYVTIYLEDGQPSPQHKTRK